MNTSIDDDLIIKKYLKLNRLLESIYPIMLTIFGFLFNSITFYIYTRKNLIKKSASFYFSFLAIVETIALLFGTFKFNLKGLLNFEILVYSIFCCKFFKSGIFILCQLQSWTLVVISFDRLFMIKYSYIFIGRKYQACRKLCISMVAVLILGINSPNIAYLTVFTDLNNQTICNFKETYNNVYNKLFMMLVDLCMTTLIPFFIMTVNGVIVFKIITNSRNKITHIGGKSLKKKYLFLSTSKLLIILN